MHMFSERLQILVTADQRRRLEAEARRRRTSIGSIIRDAIDGQIGVATRQRRLRAVRAIRAARPALFVEPGELDRLAESEHDELPDELPTAGA